MRLIARLDIKNEFVIKGINLEGLRKIGKPLEISKKLYEKKIDEIIYIDNVASLYRRNNLFSLINNAVKEIFVPITVGGGIRNLNDIKMALNSGADKVCVNSKALENPKIIYEAAKKYGSSTITSYIETKKINDKWICYKYSGREPTNFYLEEWIKIVQENGCGEILLTSIDKDGTMNGLDYDLIEIAYKQCKVPLVISGGLKDEDEANNFRIKYKNKLSIAVGSAIHYEKINIKRIVR